MSQNNTTETVSLQLKRSQKTDFTTTNTTTPTTPSQATVLMRERSFVKTNRDTQKRRSQTILAATMKGGGGGGGTTTKPTMEIYRPPNVRTDLPSSATGKLNVHAKEFTMNHHHHHHQHQLQSSKSSSNIHMNFDNLQHHLQHSKSSGNILRHSINPPAMIPILSTPLPLINSAHIFTPTQLQRVSYAPELLANPIFSGHNQQFQFAPIAAAAAAATATTTTTTPSSNWDQKSSSNHYNNNSLKRSKSLGATDSKNLTTKIKNLITKDTIDFSLFNRDDEAVLKQAVDDPNQLSSRTVMDLVRIILERIVQGIRYCEQGAKICIAIIEKEKNHTFLETLLNTCQQWYQERDKILRGIKAGDGTRFTAFMWFLTEMCSQLKRHQINEQYEFTLQPDLVLLSVLAKCCQACVSLPIKCLSETECLFFVLTSIGRDLETELPQQLEQLLACVRDGFLASAGSPAVRRTLLQLIELHASNWQLPGSSVLYYYPRIK